MLTGWLMLTGCSVRGLVRGLSARWMFGFGARLLIAPNAASGANDNEQPASWLVRIWHKKRQPLFQKASHPNLFRTVSHSFVRRTVAPTEFSKADFTEKSLAT